MIELPNFPRRALTDDEIQETVDRAQARRDREQEEVSTAVDEAVDLIDNHGATPGALTELFDNPGLTDDQKNQAVAELLQMADGEGALSEAGAETMLSQLNEYGVLAHGDDPYAEELHENLQRSITANVDSGALDAEDLFHLVAPDGPRGDLLDSQGRRDLLARVSDGAVLSDVSGMLIETADNQGYDNLTDGPSTLIGAADIANMAMLRGDQTAAKSFYEKYDELRADGIMDQMMEVGGVSPLDGNGIDDRAGVNVLARLASTGDFIAGVSNEQSDRMFADVVRGLNHDGLYPKPNQADGTRRLALHFERNADRLIDADWRHEGTSEHYHGITQSVVENVLLHDDFKQRDQLVSVLSDQLHEAAAIVGDTDASFTERTVAAEKFGTITGSFQQGTENYISSARADAEQRISNARFVTDLFTNELISWGSKPLGPAGKPVNAGSKAAVDAIWQHVEDGMVREAERELDTRSGGLSQVMSDIRLGLIRSSSSAPPNDDDLPADVFFNVIDNRHELYNPGE